MEPFRIYGKTELGTATLGAARGALASSARQLLILIDGHRSVGELEGMFGADSLARLLPQLEAQGYVQFLRHDTPGAAPARPVTPAAVQPAAVAAHAAAPAPAAPAPPRNRLAVSLLALAVLGASAAIWWFFGQPQVPATNSTDTVTRAPAVESTPAAALDAPAAVPAPGTPATPLAAADRPAQRLREASRSEVRGEPRADARSATSAAAAAPAPPARPSGAGTGPSPTGESARAPANPAPVALAPVSPPAAPPPASSNGTILGGATPAGGAATAASPGSPPAGSTSATAPAPASSGPAAASPGALAAAANTAATAARTGSPVPATALSSTAPVLHPRQRTMPVLSRAAHRSGVDSGELIVRLHVSARGTVDAIDIVKAEPRQVYDITVEETLKKWTFDPPGVPVETKVAFSFKP
jgi:TonB family protein